MTPFAHALAAVASSVAGLHAVVGSRDAAAAPVVLAGAIPCDEAADIQDKVRLECTELNARISTYVQAFAHAKGVDGAQLGDR
jgi:hypothetical protein